MAAKEIIAMRQAKAGYSHNTRIMVKCNPACQNHTLKTHHLLEVFTADSGRRGRWGRWRAETNLRASPVSLQPKDPTSQVIRQQPLHFISTFFYLQAGTERRWLRELLRKDCSVCALAGRGGSDALLLLCAVERGADFQSPSSSEVLN